MKYAVNTSVSSERSKAEIERMLTRYGATSFASGWQNDQAVIQFHMRERRIKFVLPLPSKATKTFTHSKRGPRREDEAYKLWEKATRQRWRALALVVKAKLEAVEAQIASFEDEFLSYIVLPNGKTLGEQVKPAIAECYKTGKVSGLLLLPGW